MGITNGNRMGMGMKTRLNLGVGIGMGMNHWEWEGMGLKSHSRSSLVRKGSICERTNCTQSVNITKRWSHAAVVLTTLCDVLPCSLSVM